MSPSRVCNCILSSYSSIVSDLKITVLSSLKTVSNSNTLSRVTPYFIDVVPLELLPTIPPIMHLFEVDVLGPKNKP